MTEKQTATEWLYNLSKQRELDKFDLEQAKQMEADREYETKAFWFGRGIHAGRENKIEELQPKKDKL